jgi:maleylacetoacetate isomerase
MYPLKLYSYWRSSASYRVRIALNLKGVKYEQIAVNLLTDEQKSAVFAAQNPQKMVPVLLHGERVLRQSVAIMEWLEEHFEGRGQTLLGQDPRERSRIRSIVQIIVSDIAPINVLRVLHYLEREAGFTQEKKLAWMQHWMHEGFAALEQTLDSVSTGDFCEGDTPTMADCCLIPQIYNALRWKLDMSAYPICQRIYEHALQLPEFIDAIPENQPDAER